MNQFIQYREVPIDFGKNWNPIWPPAAILKKKDLKKEKLGIDLKWREMRSKVLRIDLKFCEKKSNKLKVAYWSKMARNAIESDFRSSKMAAGGHFVKKMSNKINLSIDLKWREMWSKVIFGHPKWPQVAILWKQIKRKLHMTYLCTIWHDYFI